MRSIVILRMRKTSGHGFDPSESVPWAHRLAPPFIGAETQLRRQSRAKSIAANDLCSGCHLFAPLTVQKGNAHGLA